MKIVDDDAFCPLGPEPTKKPTPRRQATKWVSFKVVPDTAPAPNTTHYKHRTPSFVHAYRDADGKLLGFVCRFDPPGCDKLFCPLTYCENAETGKHAWRWKSWAAPRPLYGLDRLAAASDARVIVCEGEKAADAAQQLLPGSVVVTSPNGAKSATKADWKPLAGRSVTIWPDNDGAGINYASDVVRLLRSARGKEGDVSVIPLQDDRPTGWDAADALAMGWMTPDAEVIVLSAMKVARDPKDPTAKDNASVVKEGGKETLRRGTRIRNSLLEMVEGCEFWHDAERKVYATVPIGNHAENMRLTSQDFAIWYSGQCHKNLSEPVGEQILRDTLRVLEAKAIHEGKKYQTFRRVGGVDGRIFIDLCDPEWQVIEIDDDGWRISDDVPPKSIRTSFMLPLPMPEAGELLENELRPLLNVGSDRDFRLVVAWLVAACRDVGEYPVLSINGEQGSAKSTMARMIRMLVDPNKATNRAAPRDERDLIVAANNAWVVSLDNMSTMSQWLSDALCRIATGGGFSTRALHTDMDEVVVELENPIILNGIPEIAGRPDLADRSIMLTLPTLGGESRRSKDELWTEFEARRPFVLGALLDAVSAALRELPRMANAAKWVTAAEAGLGWDAGTHIADLEANRRRVVEASVDNEPVALAIMGMNLPWDGTKAELHAKLNGAVAGFPKSVQQLGIAIKRVKPMLAEVGVEIIETRGKERRASIRRIEE